METTQLPPKTYLAESILVTLFCCLPLGVMGIINASKVSSLYAAGQHAAAEQASAEAKKWVKYGFIGGLAVIVLYCIFLFITAFIGASAR